MPPPMTGTAIAIACKTISLVFLHLMDDALNLLRIVQVGALELLFGAHSRPFVLYARQILDRHDEIQ